MAGAPARLPLPHPRTHAVLVTVAFALFWVPVIIFAKLAGEVVEREPLGPDAAILHAAYALHGPVLNVIFLSVTATGQPLVVTVVALALVGLFLARRLWRDAALIVVGVGGAAAANVVLKLIFERTRPSIFTPLVHETSYSFPSGHAMVSAAFVTVMIVIAWRTRFRTAALILGPLVTLLIGASRVYLGVHYPSDVLAGWSVGVTWALIAGSLVVNRPFALGHRFARLIHRTAA